jgi:hypothetical protein
MNQRELKELIEFLIEKDIAEFELERGDVKVKIRRGGQTTVVHAHAEMPYPSFRGAGPDCIRVLRSGSSASVEGTRGGRKPPYC